MKASVLTVLRNFFDEKARKDLFKAIKGYLDDDGNWVDSNVNKLQAQDKKSVRNDY